VDLFCENPVDKSDKLAFLYKTDTGKNTVYKEERLRHSILLDSRKEEKVFCSVQVNKKYIQWNLDTFCTNKDTFYKQNHWEFHNILQNIHN
jgi:hypothetical protein